jgi:phosphoglycolate phosphatase-like HAD superfamily hydrolase
MPTSTAFARMRVGRRLVLQFVALALAACAGGMGGGATASADPLPSWSDGAARKALISFVHDVTTEGSSAFVPAPQRIAVFDNDGTLWTESPQYTQVLFMLEQVKAAAPLHPEWQDNPVFRALAAHDEAALKAAGEDKLLALLVQANSGMSTEAYDQTIRAWLASARSPKFARPFTELVYQPQLELLRYLRANGFQTWIVTGGTVEFVRAFSDRAYGIPPQQVVGSSQSVRYAVVDGARVLVRDPRFEFNDDGPGKPVGIYKQIGRRPILAFGNSDGDLQMLQYTTDGPGRTLALIVHHDDAAREAAYDRHSAVGQLDKAWDEANAHGWVVVSMKDDWKQVFPTRP